jgi:hypothetical protein
MKIKEEPKADFKHAPRIANKDISDLRYIFKVIKIADFYRSAGSRSESTIIDFLF